MTFSNLGIFTDEREVIASSIVYLYMLPHLLMTDRDNVESL